MEFERMRRRSHAVNLTPLVDVFFLLMIFFMLTTSFVESESIELQLPAQGAATVTSDDVLQMLVQANGEVEIGNTVYDKHSLRSLIRDKLKANPNQKTLILSTPGVKVQQLVSVMDMIYVNGGRNVQIDHYNQSGNGPDLGHDVKLAE